MKWRRLANHTSPALFHPESLQNELVKAKFSYETGPPHGCEQSTGGQRGVVTGGHAEDGSYPQGLAQ